MNEITQNGLKLVVLGFGFVSAELTWHRLRSNRFGTQSILASTFGTDYILAGMYGTDYILCGTYGTDYILLGLYVRHRLYCSR